RPLLRGHHRRRVVLYRRLPEFPRRRYRRFLAVLGVVLRSWPVARRWRRLLPVVWRSISRYRGYHRKLVRFSHAESSWTPLLHSVVNVVYTTFCQNFSILSVTRILTWRVAPLAARQAYRVHGVCQGYGYGDFNCDCAVHSDCPRLFCRRYFCRGPPCCPPQYLNRRCCPT